MKTAIIRKFGVLAVMAGIGFNAAGFSICAVGDSITQGGTAFTAHRVALEKEFAPVKIRIVSAKVGAGAVKPIDFIEKR